MSNKNDDNDDDVKISFWQTMPGCITAIAGLLTAIVAGVIGLTSAGFIKPPFPITTTPSPAPSATMPGSNVATGIVTNIPNTAPSSLLLTATPALPASTPLPGDLVWFAPNMGSRDYTTLFTEPEQWVLARNEIDVFKFYTPNLLPHPCDICGDNILDAFVEVDAFRTLSEWGIPISVEVGAVKEWGCFDGANKEELRVVGEVVRNVRANGGDVAILAMDEPRLYGESSECSYTVQETASLTAEFIKDVGVSFPNMVIGDIEPYPHYSFFELRDWVLELEKNGVTLAFFHLDVDIERVRVEGQNVARDLQSLNEFFHERRIPFGVIFTSNWREAGSNAAYYDSTMQWIRTVNDAIGKPPHIIFQSWQGPAANGIHEVPINLWNNDPDGYSHIRLIRDGLNIFGIP